jgi:hypothetical protein
MNAALMSLECHTALLLLIVNGLAPCAAVSMVPQGLRCAAVTAVTGPASASYDVDAATMHIQVCVSY